MKTYIIILDGFRFTDQLTESEAETLKQDQNITIIEA